MQAMARLVMSQAMLRISSLGYKIVTTVHDEIVVLVSEKTAHEDFEAVRSELIKSPTWLPGIPLDAEGCVSKFYDK